MKNPKTKKILFFTGLTLDVAIIVFLFVVAIIMIATLPEKGQPKELWEKEAYENGQFIGYLQTHTTLYFWVGVFPLLVLLAANIVFLILYVRKLSKKPEVAVDDLSEEQKAALRAELLKQLEQESKAPAEEAKAEEPKEEK